MAGPTLKIKECNFVDNDAIWATHCSNEFKTSKLWNEKWGFLLEDYGKLEKQSRALSKQEKSIKDDANKQVEINSDEISRRTASDDKEKSSRLPRTSTGMVGWLVVTGKSPLLTVAKESRRGKHDILNQLGWPLDGVN